MNHHVIITQLPADYRPWAWALRVVRVEQELFPTLIGNLKAVPARKRKWDPNSKQWLFRHDLLDAIIGIVEALGLTYAFGDIAGDEKANHRNLPMSRAQAAAALYLLPTAPDFVVSAAYRAMAKHCHPDAGGSTEQMQRINAAMEALA